MALGEALADRRRLLIKTLMARESEKDGTEDMVCVEDIDGLRFFLLKMV